MERITKLEIENEELKNEVSFLKDQCQFISEEFRNMKQQLETIQEMITSENKVIIFIIIIISSLFLQFY